MTVPQGHETSDPPVGPLACVLTDLLHVLQGEVRLGRAEVARGLRGILRGLALLVSAALLGLVAITTAAGAAVSALVALGLSPAWAGVAVSGTLLFAAIGAIWIAGALLNPMTLLPLKSLARLRADLETLRAMVTPDARQETTRPSDPQPASDRGAA